MSVCLSRSFKSSLLIFVSRWNRAIFGRQLSMWHSTKKLFFDFWFRPPKPQNLLPKICHEIAYKSTCMADRPEMFGSTTLLGGFRGWPIQWNHIKCCGADPCFHGNEILAKIDYNSACIFKLILLFLFLDGIEPFFGRQFSMWHSTKLYSSILDLGPLTHIIYSPKCGKKSCISPLVWQIDRTCLHLPGSFRGWPI